MILDHDEFKNYDFSSLIYIMTAGEAIQGVSMRWEKTFGKRIYNGYGCGNLRGITGTDR